MGAGEARPDSAMVIIILLSTASSEHKHKRTHVHTRVCVRAHTRKHTHRQPGSQTKSLDHPLLNRLWKESPAEEGLAGGSGR